MSLYPFDGILDRMGIGLEGRTVRARVIRGGEQRIIAGIGKVWHLTCGVSDQDRADAGVLERLRQRGRQKESVDPAAAERRVEGRHTANLNQRRIALRVEASLHQEISGVNVGWRAGSGDPDVETL